jgi:hypothetical protein
MNPHAETSPVIDSASFSQEAWRQVKLDAPAELSLYGAQNRGFLDMTLANDSVQALNPGADHAIAFSFRLLDQRGEILPLEGNRTPLTRVIEAGAKHTQKVEVSIPSEYLGAVAAVRIGLVHEGQYWVESLYPEHPRTVKISPRGELDSLDARLAAAGQLWESGKSNGLRWPYGSMMVSERHKLLYIPVAKCACTSLKSMMVELAGIERPDIARELDVHFVTDRFNTGVQLKDKPIELARDILASDQYLKFGVIRDPFERLVSAYLEKFVHHRASRNNLAHTEPLIRQAQSYGQFDAQVGISFDQFVETILRQDPYDLDPHWRPQYLHFLGVKHMSRVFRLDNSGELERYLLQQVGIEVQLEHRNKTNKSDVLLEDAASLTAAELNDRGPISPASFLSAKNSAAIRQYYVGDCELYEAAT